jgi:hypothetical protein
VLAPFLQHLVARRERCELDAPIDEEPVGGDEQGLGPLTYKACEGGIDLFASAGVEHLRLQPDGACSFRYVS